MYGFLLNNIHVYPMLVTITASWIVKGVILIK